MSVALFGWKTKSLIEERLGKDQALPPLVDDLLFWTALLILLLLHCCHHFLYHCSFFGNVRLRIYWFLWCWLQLQVVNHRLEQLVFGNLLPVIWVNSRRHVFIRIFWLRLFTCSVAAFDLLWLHLDRLLSWVTFSAGSLHSGLSWVSFLFMWCFSRTGDRLRFILIKVNRVLDELLECMILSVLLHKYSVAIDGRHLAEGVLAEQLLLVLG